MSESVEQAALRRAERADWQARARREAAAVLDSFPIARTFDRDTLIGLLAIAWLQGVSLGSHETLAAAEAAFDNVRAAL